VVAPIAPITVVVIARLKGRYKTCPTENYLGMKVY
jgi:hypothetical protein